ncbi:hypothetical protein MBLNU230_g5838t1 [Neophaeotheca triangularis]
MADTKQTAMAASARGASFLILIQIASRALTFALNQLILRFLSPTLLGASVQLELFTQSVLYFSRESLRIACQRRTDSVQAAINLSWLAVASGIPISVALAETYLRSGNLPDLEYARPALRVAQLATLVELLSEPAFVACQQGMLYKTRAAAEAAAVVFKTLATTGVVFWSRYRSVEVGVLPFAVGELAYSASLTAVYLWHVSAISRKDGFSLLPQKITSSKTTEYIVSLFSRPLLSLSLSLYLQNGIKYILTQGDSLLIAALASLEDQGTYALSANYGGLIARMLFRPVEDSARNLFADLCSKPAESTPNPPPDNDPKPDLKLNLHQAAQTLQTLLHASTLLALFATSLGPTTAPLLLELVAGSRWTATPAAHVLGTYCYYIPLLALNGVTEAFVSATASGGDLKRQSVWMGVFFAFFATSAWVFIRKLGWGAEGVVWANVLHMVLRVGFNVRFVRVWFQGKGMEFELAPILPNRYAVAIALVVPALLKQTQGLLGQYGLLGELVRVGCVAVVFAGFVAFTERRFLVDTYQRFAT